MKKVNHKKIEDISVNPWNKGNVRESVEIFMLNKENISKNSKNLKF